jgi:hypothetical protein
MHRPIVKVSYLNLFRFKRMQSFSAQLRGRESPQSDLVEILQNLLINIKALVRYYDFSQKELAISGRDNP